MTCSKRLMRSRQQLIKALVQLPVDLVLMLVRVQRIMLLLTKTLWMRNFALRMKALAPASQLTPFFSPKDPAFSLGLFSLFFWLFEVVEKATDKVIIRKEKHWEPLKGKDHVFN